MKNFTEKTEIELETNERQFVFNKKQKLLF